MLASMTRASVSLTCRRISASKIDTKMLFNMWWPQMLGGRCFWCVSLVQRVQSHASIAYLWPWRHKAQQQLETAQMETDLQRSRVADLKVGWLGWGGTWCKEWYAERFGCSLSSDFIQPSGIQQQSWTVGIIWVVHGSENRSYMVISKCTDTDLPLLIAFWYMLHLIRIKSYRIL